MRGYTAAIPLAQKMSCKDARAVLPVVPQRKANKISLDDSLVPPLLSPVLFHRYLRTKVNLNICYLCFLQPQFNRKIFSHLSTIINMIATLATRLLQLMFAVIVLGLSIHASQWQNIGSVPATTSYSAFAGAFAVFVSLVGIVAIWMSAIPSLIMSAVDALASVLLLAGGVVSFRPTNSFASTPANINLRHSPSSSRVSTVAPTKTRTTIHTRTSSSTVVALTLKASPGQDARLDLVWKSCPADAKQSRLTPRSSSLHASLASLLRCFAGWPTGVVARARAQLSELLTWTDEMFCMLSLRNS